MKIAVVEKLKLNGVTPEIDRNSETKRSNE